MMVSDQQFEQTSTGVGVGPAGENRTGGELGGVPVLEVGGSYRWLRLIQPSTQRLKTSGESEVKTVERIGVSDADDGVEEWVADGVCVWHCHSSRLSS